jgi:hypothetical protein
VPASAIDAFLLATGILSLISGCAGIHAAQLAATPKPAELKVLTVGSAPILPPILADIISWAAWALRTKLPFAI